MSELSENKVDGDLNKGTNKISMKFTILLVGDFCVSKRNGNALKSFEWLIVLPVWPFMESINFTNKTKQQTKQKSYCLAKALLTSNYIL